MNSSRNATTIFNPSPLPTPEQISKFPWEKVNWLIVNEGEAQDLYSILSQPDPKTKPADSWSHEDLLIALAALPPFTTTNIICTLGSAGVLAFIPDFHTSEKTPTLPPIRLPAAELHGLVRDTTGAGDCFTGYFVQGLMKFGPHAKLDREIKEHDVVNILKRCVQASLNIGDSLFGEVQ